MEIKILKKENEVSKVEIDGREYKNISKVEIKNDYTSNGINESVIIEFKDISLLEISTDKWRNNIYSYLFHCIKRRSPNLFRNFFSFIPNIFFSYIS